MKFDSYHPMLNLFYFTVVFAEVICFRHPVFLALSYLCIFLYSVALRGRRAVIFNLCLLIVPIVYAGIYSYYNHFGITNLKSNFIGNQITLEAVVSGFVIGVVVITVLMLCSCLFTVMSADKITYLFGRISPRLSLFVSIVFRGIPRVGERGKRIELSRKGVGKGCSQGNLLERLKHCVAFLSILVTWTLEDLVESTASMKCRGYSLKGRTAFSIYRFDNRDRCFVVVLTLLFVITLAGAALNQTNISYNPEILWNHMTGASFLFYAAYGAEISLPLILQLWSGHKFKRERKH